MARIILQYVQWYSNLCLRRGVHIPIRLTISHLFPLSMNAGGQGIYTADLDGCARDGTLSAHYWVCTAERTTETGTGMSSENSHEAI